MKTLDELITENENENKEAKDSGDLVLKLARWIARRDRVSFRESMDKVQIEFPEQVDGYMLAYLGPKVELADLEPDTPDVKLDAGHGDDPGVELVNLAEKIEKERTVSYATAMDIVATEHPDLIAAYQRKYDARKRDGE